MTFTQFLRARELHLLAFGLSLYLLTMGGHLYSIDDEIKGLVAEAIVERRAFTLPRVEMVFMTAGRGGLSYSSFPLGSSLAMIPLYQLGALLSDLFPSLPRKFVIEFCYSLLNPMVSALTLVTLYSMLRTLRFSDRSSLITALVYGFGTIAWPYAKTAWSEPLATLFILLSLLSVLRYSHSGRRSWMLIAGASAGFSITTKYEMAAFSVLISGLAVYFAVIRESRSWRGHLALLTLYGLPLAFFAFLNLFYNYIRFENIWGLTYTKEIVQHIEQTSPLFDSIKGVVIGFYQRLFSTGKGMLLYSPPLLMYYWGMKMLWKTNRPMAIFCLALPLFYMTGLGAFWMMSRIAWGERYLFALTPFMMIPLACLVSGLIDERSAYMKKSMITLAAAGLCVQILGISINPQTIIDKQVAAGDRGNIQLLSYDPESSLLYLHFKECFTRAEDTWTLLRSGPETFLRGEASDHNDVTDVIRLRTYDFWFLYLYFFKFPVLLIIIPFFLLTGGAVYVGRTLWS